MHKEDLALNNLPWLICHKTQPNQITYIIYTYKEDLSLNNLQRLIHHKTQPKQFVSGDLGSVESNFITITSRLILTWNSSLTYVSNRSI